MLLIITISCLVIGFLLGAYYEHKNSLIARAEQGEQEAINKIKARLTNLQK